MKWLVLAGIVGIIAFGITSYIIDQESKIAELNLKAQNLKLEELQELKRQRSSIESKQKNLIETRAFCLDDAEKRFHRWWNHEHDTLYPHYPHNSLPNDNVQIGHEMLFSIQKECQLSFDNQMRLLN